ncbi:MAG: DUF4388 domain-containing protein [Deltaproteobacteria bacterium]|nr:DUF4388 domain-containing protein [Deltaproteobacteria bacterium]
MVKKGFSGHIEGVQIDDLFQMLCQTHSSVEMKVNNNLESCIVQLKDGEVNYSSCGEKRGEEALIDMLTWKSGKIEIKSSFALKERNVHRGWMELLLESARVSDKQRVKKEKVISTEEVGRIERSDEKMFYEYVDKGWDFFQQSNYKEALQEWEKAHQLRPDNKLVLFNLKKIRELIKQR